VEPTCSGEHYHYSTGSLLNLYLQFSDADFSVFLILATKAVDNTTNCSLTQTVPPAILSQKIHKFNQNFFEYCNLGVYNTALALSELLAVSINEFIPNP